MPWIIRNAAGEICGRNTNKPGEGNLFPDGTPELHEYLDADTPESLVFMNRVIPKPVDKMAQLEQRIAALEAK